MYTSRKASPGAKQEGSVAIGVILRPEEGRDHFEDLRAHVYDEECRIMNEKGKDLRDCFFYEFCMCRTDHKHFLHASKRQTLQRPI